MTGLIATRWSTLSVFIIYFLTRTQQQVVVTVGEALANMRVKSLKMVCKGDRIEWLKEFIRRQKVQYLFWNQAVPNSGELFLHQSIVCTSSLEVSLQKVNKLYRNCSNHILGDLFVVECKAILCYFGKWKYDRVSGWLLHGLSEKIVWIYKQPVVTRLM